MRVRLKAGSRMPAEAMRAPHASLEIRWGPTHETTYRAHRMQVLQSEVYAVPMKTVRAWVEIAETMTSQGRLRAQLAERRQRMGAAQWIPSIVEITAMREA